MTFLQPFILFALPLIALPILIHLINQNRHKTIHWAATMFLLQARKMSRGMARLRYLLIMLARMLAIAGLLFAISRPMAGGWLSLTAGSKPETTIIILDRSASMEELGEGSSLSKRETALQKLSTLIQEIGPQSQLVLFESVGESPVLMNSPRELMELPQTAGTSTSADLPALLTAVTEYIVTNETGRTDVWICSDLRQNDWNPSGGRWEPIRKQLSDREGVRLYLLNYPQAATDNLSVSVSKVHRRETGSGAELVMDLRLTRLPGTDAVQHVPVNIVINGARSLLEVQMTGAEVIRNGHVIPLADEAKSGWGRVEIPGDANPIDNIYNFVYSEPAVQKTVIVSDQTDIAELLRLVAETGTDRNLSYEASIVSSAAAATLPWKEAGLILWQAPLPTGLLTDQLRSYLDSGRSIIFFPPEVPDDAEFLGQRWKAWRTGPEAQSVMRWRTDADLLSNTQSGAPLPVGELKVRRHCEIEHTDATQLSGLADGTPLLLRANSGQGRAYFCTTLPRSSDSSLTDNGIVLYVMIHRALADGSAKLGSARQLESGTATVDAMNWEPLDELTAAQLVSQRSANAGLYTSGEGVSIAVNRPLLEDSPATLSDEMLEQLLGGINYTTIADEAGSTTALASEVWRTFLMVMIAALLVEAVLCIPERGDLPRQAAANPASPQTV